MVTHTDGGYETDAKAGEEATSKEERDGGGNGLEDDAKIEDPSRDHETPFSANIVGEEYRGQGAEECAGGEDGHDSRGLGRRNIGLVISVKVAGAELPLPVFLCIYLGQRTAINEYARTSGRVWHTMARMPLMVPVS